MTLSMTMTMTIILTGFDIYADADPNDPPEPTKDDLESLKTEILSSADISGEEDESKMPSFAWIPHGNPKLKHHLMTMTTCPVSRGFPFFVWPQMFFSGLDSAAVGWYKGVGEFTKPALYGMADVSKLVKPLPYNVLSKVHDCLTKIKTFMTTNKEELKIALIWKGIDSLEIYEKVDESSSALSPLAMEFLRHQLGAKPAAEKETK